MYKLSHLVDGKWTAHSYKPVFEIAADGSRVVSVSPDGNTAPFERLVQCLAAPYFLLYVLHTPRGEGEAGRYQSPQLSSEQLLSFIEKFRGYLASDARFDIWAYSQTERATVVWDRHNQVFGYGPAERFATELRALGFYEGTSQVPLPHQHHYHAECDSQAGALLSELEWVYSPLRPEDEQ